MLDALLNDDFDEIIANANKSLQLDFGEAWSSPHHAWAAENERLVAEILQETQLESSLSPPTARGSFDGWTSQKKNDRGKTNSLADGSDGARKGSNEAVPDSVTEHAISSHREEGLAEKAQSLKAKPDEHIAGQGEAMLEDGVDGLLENLLWGTSAGFVGIDAGQK